MGSPAPTIHAHQRYYVRTWNPTVVYCNDSPGLEGCSAWPYAYWTADGQPTPQRVRTVEGDFFSQPKGSRDIYAYGFGLGDRGHLMTPAEWRAAGSPVPAPY